MSKAKAHGIIMIIVWMFLVPFGIIIARHHKNLLPEKQICGVKVWFAIHMPLMILCWILSFIALLIILYWMGWSWVSPSAGKAFAHSIIGIIVIIFAFIQVIFCFKFSVKGVSYPVVEVFLNKWYTAPDHLILQMLRKYIIF